MKKMFLLGLIALCCPAQALAHIDDHVDEPRSSSATYTTPVKLSGRVAFIESENSKSGHSTEIVLLTSQRQFLLVGKTTGIGPGQDLEVSGRLANESVLGRQALFVDSFRVLRQGKRQPKAQGARGLVVAFPSWTGSGASGYGRYAADIRNLDDWFSQASAGAFTWDPIDVVNLPLAEPLVSCAHPQTDQSWSSTIKEALVQEGYDLDTYRALALAMPEGFARECIPTAYAYVDSSCSWLEEYWCGLSVYSSAYSDLSTFIHELGHTILLPHANNAPCFEGPSPRSLTYTGQCYHIEYGDHYDPMGSGFFEMYNPAFSNQLGWVSAEEIISLSESSEETTNISLAGYGESSGKRVLRIDLPESRRIAGGDPGEIYLEYRADLGLDRSLYDGSLGGGACLPITPDHNLFLRYLPSAAAAAKLDIAPNKNLWGYKDESYLLDMTPETGTICDAGLAPGSSWRDPTGKLEVSFVSRSADLSSAYLSVTRRPQADEPDLLLSLPSKQRSTNQARISFILSSDRPLDESSITSSDFSPSGASLERISAGSNNREYIIELLAEAEGPVVLDPSSSFAIQDTGGRESTSINSAGIIYDITGPRHLASKLLGPPVRREMEAEYALFFSEEVVRFPASALAFRGSSACRQITTAANSVFFAKCSRGALRPEINMSALEDEAGNRGSGKVVLEAVSLDDWVARPVLLRRPSGKTRSRDALFVWRKNPEASFLCALDREPMRDCALRKSYKKLSPGRHLFRLLARDSLGNRSSISYPWTITK